MLVFSDVQSRCISARLWLQVGSPKRLRSDLNQTVSFPPTLFSSRHRKMKPFPATAPQEKSHVRNWRSKGHLAPLMRPTKFPEFPVSLERNSEVFRHPLL